MMLLFNLKRNNGLKGALLILIKIINKLPLEDDTFLMTCSGLKLICFNEV